HHMAVVSRVSLSYTVGMVGRMFAPARLIPRESPASAVDVAVAAAVPPRATAAGPMPDGSLRSPRHRSTHYSSWFLGHAGGCIKQQARYARACDPLAEDRASLRAGGSIGRRRRPSTGTATTPYRGGKSACQLQPPFPSALTWSSSSMATTFLPIRRMWA